ncbi:hypothetical protein MHYP_G00007240 [Metynnis hypsauchen]
MVNKLTTHWPSSSFSGCYVKESCIFSELPVECVGSELVPSLELPGQERRPPLRCISAERFNIAPVTEASPQSRVVEVALTVLSLSLDLHTSHHYCQSQQQQLRPARHRLTSSSPASPPAPARVDE